MSLGSHQIHVTRANDRAVIDTIFSFVKEKGFELEAMELHPVLGGQVNIPKGTDPASIPTAAAILKSESELLNTITARFNSAHGRINLNFTRLRDQNHERLTLDFSAVKADQASFALDTFGALRKVFRAVDAATHLKVTQPDADKYYSYREETLNRLEKISTSLIVDQERHRKNLETGFVEREAELEKSYNAKEALLQQKTADLEKRMKEVDDRAAKHARRATRDSLKEIFNKREKSFKISDGTINLRRPVETFAIILLVIFGGLFVLTSLVSMKLVGNPQDADMLGLYIKQGTLGLAFASTAVFYIRWRNHWFERHAREEFNIKRHEIDLDRATWAVELASEWVEEKKKDIPEALLDRMTVNLFESGKVEDPKLHPAEELSSALFGASSNVKLKLQNGTEVSYDRKGIKQLQDSIN